MYKLKQIYRRLVSKLSFYYYEVRAILLPYNVIKVKGLPRTWVDRPELLFHAMFQIIIDYVELEKPFVSYEDPIYYTNKIPDLQKMKNYIEQQYGPNIEVNSMYNDNSEEGKEAMRRWNATAYPYKMEILYLYEWYKYIYPAREKYRNGFLHDLESNNQITFQEFMEIEDEYDLIEDIMLQRILEVRAGLWT